jgi:integrase
MGEKLLTDRVVAAAKHDLKSGKRSRKLADGGGLYLEIDERGRRWIYGYTAAGKERMMGLGAYPAVTLADAREQRDQWRRVLQSGKDPIAERRAARAPIKTVPTFGELAADYIERHGAGWNKRHCEQWKATTGSDCAPIADKPIDELTVDDVRGVLLAVHARAPVTAQRLRNRIAIVVEEGRMLGHFPADRINPASHRKLLPRRSDAMEHHAALDYADVPKLMAQLRFIDSVPARALEFLILTAARTGEATGMLWSEIDLERCVWTIPAGRMKANRQHRVPLSDRAAEIVAAMREVAEGPYVFPGVRGSLSHATLAGVLGRLRPDATVHGMRSAFRTWAGRNGIDRVAAELCLAHEIRGQSEVAYDHGDRLEQRQTIMASWAQHCDGGEPAPNVVSLEARRIA